MKRRLGRPRRANLLSTIQTLLFEGRIRVAWNEQAVWFCDTAADATDGPLDTAQLLRMGRAPSRPG